MSSSTNLYDVLQVSRTADASQIRASFLELARLYHPDLSHVGEINYSKFKRIRFAYEVLSDPRRRAAYDESPAAFLARANTATSRSGPPRRRTDHRQAASEFRPWASSPSSNRFLLLDKLSIVAAIVVALGGIVYVAQTEHQREKQPAESPVGEHSRESTFTSIQSPQDIHVNTAVQNQINEGRRTDNSETSETNRDKTPASKDDDSHANNSGDSIDMWLNAYRGGRGERENEGGELARSDFYLVNPDVDGVAGSELDEIGQDAWELSSLNLADTASDRSEETQEYDIELTNTADLYDPNRLRPEASQQNFGNVVDPVDYVVATEPLADDARTTFPDLSTGVVSEPELIEPYLVPGHISSIDMLSSSFSEGPAARILSRMGSPDSAAPTTSYGYGGQSTDRGTSYVPGSAFRQMIHRRTFERPATAYGSYGPGSTHVGENYGGASRPSSDRSGSGSAAFRRRSYRPGY